MRVLFFTLLLSFLLGAYALPQDAPTAPGPGENQQVPRSDRNAEAEESSSRDTKIDITPPKDDAKNHPNSASAMEAVKDIEVGDFYYKRKNYRAALDRYKEALYYKDNDAVATFRVAQCQEKLGSTAEARTNYEAYLRILPEGPFALDAQKAIDRLSGAPDGLSGKKN